MILANALSILISGACLTPGSMTLRRPPGIWGKPFFISIACKLYAFLQVCFESSTAIRITHVSSCTDYETFHARDKTSQNTATIRRVCRPSITTPINSQTQFIAKNPKTTVSRVLVKTSALRAEGDLLIGMTSFCSSG